MSLAALIAAASIASVNANMPPASAAASARPQHVWTIVLENKDYAKTFGMEPGSPYLGTELPKRGALLSNYHGTGHLSLDNYITMISGQAANPITQSDCQLFQEFVGAMVGADGQAVGQGCVYDNDVPNVADQLDAKKIAWRGYMEDMGDDLARDGAKTCAHPPVNGRDTTQSAAATSQYATRHNPFMYFHSVIDDQKRCDAHVVNLRELDKDLRSVSTTPNYSFITPDLCSDGHDEECANTKQKGGYEGIEEFLREWVPKITSSPAYKTDGLLIITFDEAAADNSACCDNPTGPNTPSPGIQGPGGGRIGMVLLSPYITPGTAVTDEIDHYGYLRTIEDLFGLEHLGYAARDGVKTFTKAFNRVPGLGAGDVNRFKVKRKGKRLIIRVSLGPGVVGRITVKRHGQTLRRFTTGGKATLRVKVPRKAKVILRAVKNGKTVKKLVRRR